MPTNNASLGATALAAAPQVTGIGYFSVEGWSLRVGRGKYGIIRPFDPQEPDPAVRDMVARIRTFADKVRGARFLVGFVKLAAPVLRIGTEGDEGRKNNN